jgi:hypothetical protein
MDFQFDLTRVEWRKDKKGLPEAILKLKIPSVSSIVNSLPDAEYDKWVESVGKDKVDKIMTSAGNRGSATHIFVENFLSNYASSKDISKALTYTQEQSPKLLESDNIPKDKIEEGRNLFYKFYYSDYSNRYSDILALEMGIYSPSLFYRGVLDIFYKDKIYGLSITDFKSSNGKIKKGSVKEEKYKYQLYAYSRCIEEMYAHKNVKVNHASILCIDKQSDDLQEIVLNGNELYVYKEKFEELVKQWHIQNKTEYLIK